MSEPQEKWCPACQQVQPMELFRGKRDSRELKFCVHCRAKYGPRLNSPIFKAVASGHRFAEELMAFTYGRHWRAGLYAAEHPQVRARLAFSGSWS